MPDEVAQVDLALWSLRYEALEPRSLEELIHDVLQLSGLGRQNFDRSAPGRRIISERAVGEHRQISVEHRNWRAQLVSREMEEGCLGLIGQLLGGVKAGQLFFSLAGFDKGGEHEGRQRQADVEGLKRHHFFEKGLGGEGAGSVDGRPDRHRRRDQRGGGRSPLAEAPGRRHDERQHQVYDPQTTLEKQVGHNRGTGQQAAELRSPGQGETGQGRSRQQAQEKGRHQQHAHGVSRPPNRPGPPEAVAQHRAG